MAKTSTRRRQKAPQREDMFSDLHEYADSLNTAADPEPQANAQPDPRDDRIARLEAALDAMQRRADEQEATNVALTTRTTQPQAPQPPAALSFEGLPDPVEDPKAYGEQLQSRIDQMIQSRMQYDRDLRAHQGAQTQTKDVLWEDFSEAFPDYAADEERVGFVTQKVLKRAAARGLDTDRYMLGNSNRFFRDIVKEYNNVFGEPETADDDEDFEPEPKPRRRTQRRAQDDDYEPRGRTGGILGGMDGGAGRQPRGRTPTDEGPGDMIKEIQEIQRKGGYY